MSEVISLYGAITGGTQDGLANIDIPADGFILGVDWDINLNMDTDAETASVELSFIATNQLATNDIRGRISSISSRLAVLSSTSGHVGSLQKWVGPFDISVSGGERIYLHCVSTAGITGEARCSLMVDLGTQVRRRARRR